MSKLVPASVGVVLLGLAACAPAAPSPPAPPKPAATTAPAQPAASPAAKPAASPAPKAAEKPALKVDLAAWEQTLAAAKREGKVSVIGASGGDLRLALTQGFEAKYPDIALEYNNIQNAQLPPKILSEQAAGQFLIDVVITGTTTALASLLPADALNPVPPYLVGPSTADPSKWLGSRLSFADEAARYNLVFGAYVEHPFIYNPDLVSQAGFKSWRDLLDPKWKGKISMRDPTIAGGALAIATFWYTTPALGKEFITQFFTTQTPTISNNDRQLLDWVARGEYPISVGPSDTQATALKRQGVRVEGFDPHLMAEGAILTSGAASLVVPKNPPHPNAAKVYLDYLLSQQGLTVWSREAGFTSLRLDVPRDHVDETMVPRPGFSYQENFRQEYVKLRNDVVEFLKSVVPS